MSQTPAQLGYRMPAEWEPHIATWFSWPRPEGISFPGKYEPVPAVYAALIKNLVKVEEVHINVWHEEMEQWVRKLLLQEKTPLERVTFHHFPSYEPWCRDHGPIFLVRDRGPRPAPSPVGRERAGVRVPDLGEVVGDSQGLRTGMSALRASGSLSPGERAGVRASVGQGNPDTHDRAIVDWGYNAWGGKYPPFNLDDAIPQHVAKYRNLPLFQPGIIMEGGSIEVNGAGTVLTTEACLLNPNRNPHLNKQQIEQYLKDYLGARQVLWLGEGIVGDDTDGHIDDLSRFVDENTIITVVEQDSTDENYDILQENLKRLQTLKNLKGEPFRIVELPMPGLLEFESQRLPASYANFYIANKMILVPTYRDPNDARALEILQKLCPGRQVIGVDSTELIWGLGSFHCISQQEPA